MGQLFNRKYMESRRKELRNNSTSAEAVLRLKLKNRQLEGRRFRRQFSVGNYILDFYCPQEKLAIELDGEVHSTSEAIAYDHQRDAYQESIGIKVLRFENRIVFDDPDYLLNEVKENFKSNRE